MVNAKSAELGSGKSPKTKTVAYDVYGQLRSLEEIAAYLDAWLTEAPDDVIGIARTLGEIARAKGWGGDLTPRSS